MVRATVEFKNHDLEDLMFDGWSENSAHVWAENQFDLFEAFLLNQQQSNYIQITMRMCGLNKRFNLLEAYLLHPQQSSNYIFYLE